MTARTPTDAPVVTDIARLVVFRLDERRYALPVATVDRVVRAVDVTPLPNAPAIVLGVVDVYGRLWPVLDVRRRFQAAAREIRPADWFLLAHTGSRSVILVVDGSDGVVERPSSEVIPSSQVVARAEQFPGAVILEDGIVWIHDLETFLSIGESRALDAALAARAQP